MALSTPAPIPSEEDRAKAFEDSQLSTLRSELSAEYRKFIEKQKAEYLLHHVCPMTLFEEQKGKVVQRPCLLSVSSDRTKLVLLASEGSPPEAIASFTLDSITSFLSPEQLPKSFASSAVSSSSTSAASSSGSKKSREVNANLPLFWGIKTASADTERTLGFLAASPVDLSSSLDGLRALRRQPILAPQSQEDLQSLVSAEIAFRMINLKGIRPPSAPPQLPPTPPPPLPV